MDILLEPKDGQHQDGEKEQADTQATDTNNAEQEVKAEEKEEGKGALVD